MPQKNPTLIAETQVLDPAHPFPRVGSGGAQSLATENSFSEQLVLLSQRYEKENLTDLTQAERLQLSEAARLSLEDEIVLMREHIKIFASASKEVKEGEDYNEALGKVLNLLGLSCNRLAGLMRVQLLLQGPQSAGLLEDLIGAMSDFVDNMTAEEGGQND